MEVEYKKHRPELPAKEVDTGNAEEANVEVENKPKDEQLKERPCEESTSENEEGKKKEFYSETDEADSIDKTERSSLEPLRQTKKKNDPAQFSEDAIDIESDDANSSIATQTQMEMFNTTDNQESIKSCQFYGNFQVHENPAEEDLSSCSESEDDEEKGINTQSTCSQEFHNPKASPDSYSSSSRSNKRLINYSSTLVTNIKKPRPNNFTENELVKHVSESQL